jgi:hypothetical protein
MRTVRCNVFLVELYLCTYIVTPSYMKTLALQVCLLQKIKIYVNGLGLLSRQKHVIWVWTVLSTA